MTSTTSPMKYRPGCAGSHRLRTQLAGVDAAGGDFGLAVALAAVGRELQRCSCPASATSALVAHLGQRGIGRCAVPAPARLSARRAAPVQRVRCRACAAPRALAAMSASARSRAGREVEAQRRRPRASRSRSAASAGPLRPRCVNSRSSWKHRCRHRRRSPCRLERQPGQCREGRPAARHRRSAARAPGAARRRRGRTGAPAGSRSRWRRSWGSTGRRVATTSCAAPTVPRSVSSSKPCAPWRAADHRARLPALDAGRRAFGQQHIDDLLAGAVAEQLALVLFVAGDAMALHQRDEVARRVARERRTAEVGVGRQKVLRPGRRGW